MWIIVYLCHGWRSESKVSQQKNVTTERSTAWIICQHRKGWPHSTCEWHHSTDRQCTVEYVPQTTGASHDTVFNIRKHRLQYRRVSLMWVSLNLTPEQKLFLIHCHHLTVDVSCTHTFCDQQTHDSLLVFFTGLYDMPDDKSLHVRFPRLTLALLHRSLRRDCHLQANNRTTFEWWEFCGDALSTRRDRRDGLFSIDWTLNIEVQLCTLEVN